MTRIPPPVLALSAGLVQRALTRDVQPPTAPRAAAAGATALASFALASASVGMFRRSGTTFDPFDPAQTSVLVRTGANSISRNADAVGQVTAGTVDQPLYGEARASGTGFRGFRVAAADHVLVLRRDCETGQLLPSDRIRGKIMASISRRAETGETRT